MNENDKVDVQKMKILGILWCNGEPLVKMEELYKIF